MKYAIRGAILVLTLGLAVCFAPSAKAQGACPTGTNYINPTSPSSGGGNGSVALSSLGVTKCYYVGSGGSDSNTGTSEGSPWLHAPGMPNCANTCSSAAISAGTGIIIEGGMTYHVYASTSGSTDVSMGGVWTFNHSGSSGSPVYVGIDPSWSAGASFARPIITQDNPLSTSTVSSCSHSDGGWISGSSSTNVVYDGFDLQGVCATGANGGPGLAAGSNLVERVYVHGWTLTASASDDEYKQISSSGRTLFSVIDGSDSTYGTACTASNWSSCGANGTCGTYGTHCATGWAMSPCVDVEYTVISHTSNTLECGNPQILIGDLLEFSFEPSFGNRHGNVVEALGGTTGTCKYYNNVTRYTRNGVIWWTQCTIGYFFNNVWFQSGAGNGTIILSPPGGSDTALPTAYYFANNTTDSTSNPQAYAGNGNTPYWASGSSITVENQHLIGFSSLNSWFVCGSPSSCTVNNAGGNVIQSSASTATSQGYTVSDNFAPTSANCNGITANCTVGAGISLASLCSTFSSDSALCIGTSAGVAEQSGWGGEIAVYPGANATVTARGSTWDAGAYQFGAAVSGPPSSAAGLATLTR